MNAQKKLIYLYCITKAKPRRSNFREIGIKTYPIYSQGIYAVTGRVSPDDFGQDNLKKNLTDMAWVEKGVRQHEKVIEESMKEVTVLPFKFATIFQTEKNVEKLLKENNSKFKNMIADLDGKEEWGLKVYCDSEQFKKILQMEDERIKEKDREIASAGKGKAYFLKKKKNELIKDIITEKISEYTRDSFERLKRVSSEAKINKILPKEVTEKTEDMVLNAAFLINKKRVKEFKNILDYIQIKYSGKGLNFDCTGPWPPYNFCFMGKKERQQQDG